MPGAPKLSAAGLSKFYESTGVLACRPLDIEVRSGEFLCVVGPSGCGKTTLLRMLAKLLTPSAGTVTWHPARPSRPFVGVVLQDLALLPWKTALQNVSLALKYRGVPGPQRDGAARQAMRQVGLDGFDASYPHQLSSGMRQRVALARALLGDPELLLMDEPFASLDAATRVLMQMELLRLWEAQRNTVILVTHSLEEAVFLADRVVLLTAGPGQVKLDAGINLPRPRSAEIRGGAPFAALVSRLWQALAEEIAQPAGGPAGGPWRP